MYRKLISVSKTFFVFLLSVFVMLAGCTSAANSLAENINGVTIRISMYNDIAYSGWRTYVEEQFPEVNFIWENNRNSTQNLIYQAEHGDMADIVNIRRFEADSAAEIAPYLADLSGQSLTKTFTAGSLDSFTFSNQVCWLPGPGMIESLYANASLFEKYNIKIPETRQELLEACQEFQQHNIDGLALETSAGFRSTFLLEGFAHDYFSSPEGKQWLSSFQKGEVTALPENGCIELADLLREMQKYSVLDENDRSLDAATALNEFDTNQAAMINNGSDETYVGKEGTKYAVIPCLGETADDQTLYTYPVFETAISKKAEEDPDKKEIVNQILDVMYSEEAQQILAQGTDALISYNEGISLPISSLYQSVAPLIEQKKYFVRYLNRNTFQTAVAAVNNILQDQMSDQDFIAAFNENLCAPKDTTVIGSSNLAAGNQLSETYPLVRSSASVIAQTVKLKTNADAVIMEAKDAAAPIYQGSYTSSDLTAAIVDEKLYEADLSEAQLQSIFEDAMLATTTYAYGSLEPMVDYPALSGVKARLTTDGISSTLINFDGTSLDYTKTYHVVISQIILNAIKNLGNENCSSFHVCGDTLMSSFVDRLKTGILPQPQQYYEIEAAQ